MANNLVLKQLAGRRSLNAAIRGHVVYDAARHRPAYCDAQRIQGRPSTQLLMAHADMPHEVTVIKGRRFPTCRHCKGIRFEPAHGAKHVGEVDQLKEAMRRPGNRSISPLCPAP